ncbi:MAG TPA: peroxiredoxin-like family protein [Flavisolibacter sp.]|jgi:peroxiredoxin|nr:peroxiredoxin-like family protein [Flavisolibacter sp.]
MKKLLTALTFVFSILTGFSQDKPEGLFINSKAPEFKVKDQSGKEVSLKEMRKKGPVVILFYRGNWCPYCNKELKRFQDSLQYITAKGAQVVAITPEAQEGIDSTIAKTGASFPILYDEEAKIAKSYSVAFQPEEKVVGRYKSFGTDLMKINNQKVVTLPVPAVYVVNKEGSITFRYFDADYRKRVSVRDVLEALKLTF